MQRVIREVDPPKPSTRLAGLGDASSTAAQRRRTDVAKLLRVLRGDLDWITMKALEKDRTRRYGSAAELAFDIQRHLDDEPVMAGPPSTVYRLKKFVRKNRGLVTATVVVLVAILAGFVATVIEYRRAEKTAENERIALEEVERLADVKRLADLVQRSGQLRLTGSDVVVELEKWLDVAKEILAREPGHRQTWLNLHEMATASGADDFLKWRYEVLGGLVADLEKLRDPDPAVGAIARLKNLLRIARESLEHQAWPRAIASIRNRNECPKYGGNSMPS